MILGSIIAVLAIGDMINEFNNAILKGDKIPNISLSAPPYIGFPYIMGPGYGLFLSIFGIILILLALYYQRKANKEFFQSIGEHPI